MRAIVGNWTHEIGTIPAEWVGLTVGGMKRINPGCEVFSGAGV